MRNPEEMVEYVMTLEAQLKAKDEETEAFKEKLKSELEYATISGNRDDFNIPTRRYWKVKAEALSDVIEYMEETQQKQEEKR